MKTAPLAASAPAQPQPAARPDVHVAVPFSLFEGDWLNRIYAQLGLGTHRRYYLLRYRLHYLSCSLAHLLPFLLWLFHLYY